MESPYLPVLSHFQNGNGWTGSSGLLRYRISPSDQTLTAQVWEGPWCYELSRVEQSKAFSLDEAGLTELSAWILQWQQTMSARPVKPLAEQLQSRVEQAGQEAQKDSAADR